MVFGLNTVELFFSLCGFYVSVKYFTLQSFLPAQSGLNWDYNPMNTFLLNTSITAACRFLGLRSKMAVL